MFINFQRVNLVLSSWPSAVKGWAPCQWCVYIPDCHRSSHSGLSTLGQASWIGSLGAAFNWSHVNSFEGFKEPTEEGRGRLVATEMRTMCHVPPSFSVVPAFRIATFRPH